MLWAKNNRIVDIIHALYTGDMATIHTTHTNRL